nr:MAG TPA: hypothetical protein [Caudoviricetes sp.]
MIQRLELVTAYLQERFLDSSIYKINLIIYYRNVQISRLVYPIQKNLIHMIIRNCRCGRMLYKT